jgi:hypothetical protein
MVQVAADATSVAWITVIGTLGGVVVTATVGMLTASLTLRSQRERTEREHRFAVESDVRKARRDSYVRYIVSAQKVFDTAAFLYVENRAAPLDVAEFVLQPPAALAHALIGNETCRVEALLLASDPVRTVLEEFDERLKQFWKGVGSGNDSDQSESWKSENRAYHKLIAEMRADVSAF